MKIEGFPVANPGEKQIGIRSCYHLHFDPDLGANRAAVRRIPCSCKSCSIKKTSLEIRSRCYQTTKIRKEY